MDKQYTTQQFTVGAGNVQRGDVISTENPGNLPYGATVERVKVGTKYATLIDANDQPMARLYADTPVVVERQVETDESKAARRRAYVLDDIENDLAKWQPQMPKVANDVWTKAANYEKVTSFTMDALIQAQAEDKVWLGWRKAYDYLTARPEERGGPLDALQALALYVEELRKEIVRKASYGLLSRSTSVVSNVMEDAELAAKAEFVEHAERWSL